MAKKQTQAQRWSEACAQARAGLETLQEMAQDYGDRYDNMNEGLQASAYGQKCEAMQNLDVSSALEVLDEAEGLDIPLGYGRD